LNIEILYLPNCPNHPLALARFEEVLSAVNSQASVQEVPVSDVTTAQRLRFTGSPTIRIRGRDVEPEPETPSAFNVGLGAGTTATALVQAQQGRDAESDRDAEEQAA
jgi:hypothetical protein